MNDPLAKFIMDEYRLSFEEASLLLSMPDLHHTLKTFDKGNAIAEKMGLAPFNTYETTAGTVLLDDNNKIILAGLLPVSRLSKNDSKQLKESTITGMNEIRYNRRTAETLKNFYDVIIGNTITTDSQSSFLFGKGGITHLIGARFAFGVLDEGIAERFREKGDLGGYPRVVVGKDEKGKIFTLINIDSATPKGSLSKDTTALPIEMIQPNERVMEAFGKTLLGVKRSLSRKEFEKKLSEIIDANSSKLYPVEIGEKTLMVLPGEFIPNGYTKKANLKVGAVGTPHSVHMAEQLIAYAMSRNVMPMQIDSAMLGSIGEIKSTLVAGNHFSLGSGVPCFGNACVLGIGGGAAPPPQEETIGSQPPRVRFGEKFEGLSKRGDGVERIDQSEKGREAQNAGISEGSKILEKSGRSPREQRTLGDRSKLASTDQRSKITSGRESESNSSGFTKEARIFQRFNKCIRFIGV
jgi:hypothetical protein